MLLNDEIHLYRLKPPLTGLSLTRNKAFNDISLVANDRFVGRIHLTLEETPQFLLGVLAETRTEVGSIEAGIVTWFLDTVAHNINSVIDSLGNLHQVEDL